jgi:hypothetical protein
LSPTLTDLIDIEARLAADQTVAADELARRDREIGREIQASAALPRDKAAQRRYLILSWIRRLRAGRDASPGQRVARSLQATELALVLGGLTLGFTAVRVILRYDGSTPVNVVHFLAVMVAAQIALFALLLLGLLTRRLFSGKSGGQGVLQELLRALTIAKAHLPPGAVKFQRLHGDVWRWHLVSLTQKFGVAFNLAALSALIYLVTFTDLAFSWSTSLDVSPAEAHRFMRALAWPWQWLGVHHQGYVPSLELVEKTQYFRIEGRYMAAEPAARATDVRLLGSWWPFLAMALTCYGLLPRTFLYLYGSWSKRRALRRVPFDTLELDEVFSRLGVATDGWRPLGGGGEASGGEGTARSAAAISPVAGVKICDVVLWRDAPVADEAARVYLRERYGLQVGQIVHAGGRAGELTAPAAGKVASSAGGFVLVVAEAWEAPGKAVVALLKTLRQAVGPQRRILVELIHGDAVNQAERQLWRLELAKLGDPYTGLFSGGGAP